MAKDVSFVVGKILIEAKNKWEQAFKTDLHKYVSLQEICIQSSQSLCWSSVIIYTE